MNTPLLKVNALTLKSATEKKILDHLDLEIYEGEFVLLIGSNGCGKSSFLKCLLNQYEPTSGEIYYQNMPLKKGAFTEMAHEISSLNQRSEDSLFDDLTLYENIQCFSKKPISFSKAKEMLEEFSEDLSKKLKQKVHHLSGGQKQLLALALALMNQPKLLLLDEHTSALDPQKAHAVMELLMRYKQKHPKLTLLMTTHVLKDALSYGDRLCVMRDGKIIEDVKKEKKAKMDLTDLMRFY